MRWLKRRKSASVPDATTPTHTPRPSTSMTAPSPIRTSSSTSTSRSTIGPLPHIRSRNSTAPKPGAPRPFERDSVGLPLALDIHLASGPGPNANQSAASTQSFPSSIYPDPDSAFILSPAAKELDSSKVGYGFEHGIGGGGEMDEYDEDMPMPEVYMDEKEGMPAPRASLDSGILSPGQLQRLRIATPKMTQVDVHGRPLPVPTVAQETVCEVHASTEDCTDDCRANNRPRPLPPQPSTQAQYQQQRNPPVHQQPQWEGDYEYAISPDTPTSAPTTGKKRGFLPLDPSPPVSRSPSPSIVGLGEDIVPELWSPRAEREDGLDREERMAVLRREKEEERIRSEKLAVWNQKKNKDSEKAIQPLTLDLGPTLDLSFTRTPPSVSPAVTPTPTPIETIQSRTFAIEKRPTIIVKKKPKPLFMPASTHAPTSLASSIPPPPSDAPPEPPKEEEQSPLMLSAVDGPSGSFMTEKKAEGPQKVGSAAASASGMFAAFEATEKKSGSAAASAAGMAAAFEAAAQRAESPVASSSTSRSRSPAASAASMATAFETVAAGGAQHLPKKRSGSPAAASAAGMAAAFEAAAQGSTGPDKRSGSPAASAAGMAAAFEAIALQSPVASSSKSPAASAAGMAVAFEAAALRSGVEDLVVPKKHSGSSAASAAGMAAAFEMTAQRSENPIALSSRSVSPATFAAGMAAAFEAAALRSGVVPKKRSGSPATSAAAMAAAFEVTAQHAESSIASSSKSRSVSPAISASGMAAAFEVAAATTQSAEEMPRKRSGSPVASAAGMVAAFESAAQRAESPVTSRSVSPAASAAGMAAPFEATAQLVESSSASSSKSRSGSPAASAAQMAAAFEAAALSAAPKKPSGSPAASAAGMAAAFESAAQHAESPGASTSRSRSISPATSAAGMGAAFEAVAIRAESPKTRSHSPAVSAAGMAAAFETAAHGAESSIASTSRSRSISPAASAAGMAAAFESAAHHAQEIGVAEVPKKRSGFPAASAAGMAAAFEAAAQRAESSKTYSGSAAASAAGMAAAFEASAQRAMTDSAMLSRSTILAAHSAAGMEAALDAAAVANGNAHTMEKKKLSGSAAASAAGMAAAFEAAALRAQESTDAGESKKRSVSPALSAVGMAAAFDSVAQRAESPKKQSGSPASSAAGMAAAFEIAGQRAEVSLASTLRSRSVSPSASAAGMAAAFEAAAQRAESPKKRSGSPAASAAEMGAAFEAVTLRAESPKKHSGSAAASAAGMAAAFEATAQRSQPPKKASGSSAASAAGMAAAFELAAQRSMENDDAHAMKKKTSDSSAASAASMAAAFEMAARTTLPHVVEPTPMTASRSAAASAAGMVAAFEAAAAMNDENMFSMKAHNSAALNVSMRPMSTVSATTFATSVASSVRSSMTESETESMTSSGTVRPQQPNSAGLPLDVAEDMGVLAAGSSATAPVGAGVDEDDVPLSQLRNDSRRETSVSPPRRTSSLQARVGLPANPRPSSAASIPRPESSASLPRPLPAPPGGHARTSSAHSLPRDTTMGSHLMRSSSSRPSSADRARTSLSQQSSRSSLHPGSRSNAVRSGRSSPSQMPPRMSPPQGPLPSLPPSGAEGTTPVAQGTVPPTYAFHDMSNTVFEAPLAMPHALPPRAPMAEREPESSSTDSPQSQISVLTEFENTLALLDVEGEREPLPAYMLRAGTGEATLARGPRRAYRAAVPQVGGIIDINLSHLPADVRAALSGSEPSITSGAASQPQSNSPDSDASAPNWPPRGIRLEPLDSNDVTPPTYMRVEGSGERKRAKDRFKALFSRKRAISMSEAPVAVPLERAPSTMTSETSMSNSNGGGSLLRRIRSRRNDSSATVNRMSEANASMASLAEAPAVEGAMEGFEGLPSMEPAEGRPLLHDGQILVYPEGEVCPHCGNTGFLPHNHSHDGSRLACPACWPKFARPFGAKLARFFRSGSLKGPDGERVRRRLQRPLSAPAGFDHAPAATSTSSSVSRRGEDTRWVADTVTAEWPGQREARAVQALRT